MVLFLKNLLFTLLIPGTVAVYLPWLIMGSLPAWPKTWLTIIGTILITLGAGIYLWTVWDFAVAGKGTPLPIDAPKKLVVRGLYRLVRNPMYLGVIIVILGWACVFTSYKLMIYAAGVWCAVNFFVIGYEEKKLSAQFGEGYDAYRRSVGRWLPRFRTHRMR